MSARVVTVLGTASDVGKSTVVTALCRLASDAGLRVAPFKAQNMARNAFVVDEGGEIGVAQAVQAEAARVRPSVDHNPVLLKPEPGSTAQVIIHGRSVGRFRFGQSDALRETMREAARTSFDRLRATHDLVVVEGAGSPVELNLAEHDLPNLFTARLSEGPIVLVADIDRGGVFAQLAGTVALLPPDLRARVAAVVVNRLRGDPALFEDGVAILRDRLGLPVLAVVPHLPALGIPDEDSLAHGRWRARPRAALGSLEITVVDTPCLANAEDALPFEDEPGVTLRASADARELVETDLVLLLGSKSTAHDLAFLRERGLDQALRQRVTLGRPLFGVCGGLQILGRRIEDEERIESSTGSVDGLGLLPCVTRFQAEKTTRRVQANRTSPGFCGVTSDRGFEGFLLHHGRVELDAHARPFARLEDDRPEGVLSPDGRVAGTMIHRPFDDRRFRASILDALASGRGLARTQASTRACATDPIGRLAAHLEAHADPRLLASLLHPERP